MVPILLAALIVIGAVVGWTEWRRRARAMLATVPPEDFVMAQDPAWLIDKTGRSHERTLRLETAVNLRDIGGYPAAGGKRVRWGMVYRSGTIAVLSEADAEALASKGLKLICDLRSATEVEEAPYDPVRFGAKYQSMPLDADHGSLRRLRVAMFQPKRLRDLMRESYTELMLERNAPLIGRLLTLIADEENLPALIHCTAGKDRTGLAVMVLLALLGVADEVIAADYSLSNAYFTFFHSIVGKAMKKVNWIGMTADDLRPLLIADPALMREALASVREKYGTIEGYVTNRCGVEPRTVSVLRALLLEDA